MANPFDPNNVANQARDAMRRSQENMRRQQLAAQQQAESTRRLQQFGRQRQRSGGRASRVIGVFMFFLIVAVVAFLFFSGSHSTIHR
jgi:hypothetical protein